MWRYRVFLLLALAATCRCIAPAQDPEDEGTGYRSEHNLLQCRAGWFAGDTMIYTVRTAQIQKDDAHALSNFELDYDVLVTVQDSSQQGYRLTWQRRSHDLGRLRTMISAGQAAFMDSIEAIRIVILTDTAGVLIGVENYEEVTDRWMDLQERMILWLAADKDASERAGIEERLNRWRSNRSVMSRSLLQDIGVFLFPYGAYVFQDSIYSTPYAMPDLMTGGTIPAEATIGLVINDDQTYRIDVEVEPDPDKFIDAVISNLKRSRKLNAGGHRFKKKELQGMRTHMRYAFTLSSFKSWPYRSQSTVTTTLDGVSTELTKVITRSTTAGPAPLSELELDALIMDFPHDPEPYLRRGHFRAEHMDHAGAIEDYTMAISLDSSNAHTWLLRAWALRNNNQHTAALSDLDYAVTRDSMSADIHQARGRLLADLHDYPGSETSLRKALAIDSLHLRSFTSLGFVLREQYRFMEALAVYDHAITAYPDIASLYGQRAETRFHLRTPSEDSLALVDLRHALDLEPEDTGSLTAIGNHFLEVPDHDSAAYYFDRVLELDPNDATAMHNRGYARLQQGRLEEAIVDMRESLAMDSTITYAYNNIGWALHLAGRSEEGLASIDASIARMPTNAYAFYNRGRVLASLGRTVEACQAWQHAVDIGFTKAYGDEVEKELALRCGK